MGEKSQSRYGIMEELNNRKIKEKEKLANIERELDTKTYEVEKQIEMIGQEIKEQTSGYKMTHKDLIRQMSVSLNLMQMDFQKAKEELERQISEENDNYQTRFEEWKEYKERKIIAIQKDHERFQDTHNQKIKDKQGIITVIEKSVCDLKDMSKEVAKD